MSKKAKEAIEEKQLEHKPKRKPKQLSFIFKVNKKKTKN